MTPGPQRQGIIKFDFTALNLHSGSVFVVIGDGQHQYDVQSSAGGCQLHSCENIGTGPITLGSSNLYFSVESGTLLSGNFALDNAASASGQGEAVFSLYEADGVTPVEMFAVPEPTTLAFVLGAGSLLALIRRSRASRFRSE